MRIIAHTKYSLKHEQMNNNYKIVAAQIINNNLRVETVQNFFIILNKTKIANFGLNWYEVGLISL